MTRKLWVLALAALVAACSSPRSPSPPVAASQAVTPSALASPDTASAARSKAPTAAHCPPSSPDAVQVLSLVYLQGAPPVDYESVHLLTVSGGAVTDCLLFDRQPILVHDAAHGTVLLSTGDGTIWTLQLSTGSLRNTGFSRGDLFGGVISPDATEAVFATGQSATGFDIDVVQLASGASRSVLHVGSNDYNHAGLIPLRWLQSGIIVTPGALDCSPRGLLELDPRTGSLTQIADGVAGVLSSNGTQRAYSDYANLGDVPYMGECGWHNQLYAGPVGGPTVVRSQQNHDFFPLDVRDDGGVLYSSDEGPNGTATPGADMGLYLYSNGVSIKQYGEAHAAYWTSAIFVGQNSAIATEDLASGQNGSVEVILVSLCSFSGCQPSSTAIDNPTGPYPAVSFLPVRP